MTLLFPCQAERALDEFRSATKTIALATICRRAGAQVEKLWDRVEYTFDDDTVLVVRGTGRNHKVEVEFP